MFTLSFFCSRFHPDPKIWTRTFEFGENLHKINHVGIALALNVKSAVFKFMDDHASISPGWFVLRSIIGMNFS